MNKIYKVIWSKAKHCYVVVSELAKNHTKGCGRRSLRRTAVSLGIVATLLGGFSGSAWAALSAQTIDETHSGVAGGISVITGSSDEAGHIVTTNSDGDIVLLGGKTVKAYTLSAAEGGIVSYSGDLEIHSGDRTSPKTFFVDAATGNITVTGDYSTTNGNITTTNGTITGKDVTATGEVSGATATITGAVSVGGTLGVTGEATVGSLKIGTTSYGITSEGAATVSSLTVGTTLTIGTTEVETAGLTGTHTIASDSTGFVSGEAVYNALAAKADATSVSAIDTRLTTAEGGLTTLNTNTQYVSSAGENKTTITGTLEVVGTDNESGGVINVNGLGSGINITGTGSFLKVGNGNANYALEVDVGNNQVKAASGNIILDSNGALTTKYSGQTVFEVNPGTYNNQLIFDGRDPNGAATFKGYDDNKVTLKNGAITATGAISGKTITATDNLYIGTGDDRIDVATALAGSGVIAATGETGASGLVKGSTVYDYLNGAKLDLGAESTQIEIGQNSTASGNYAIAIGTGTGTDEYSNIIHTTASGESSIAIGNSAEATSGYTIAIGANAKVNSLSGTGTIAIGYNANAYGNDPATAIGRGATSFQGTAIGYSANANGAGATALGGFADANSEYATAVGLSAKANSEYATVVGAYAQASGLNSIAIGGGELETDTTDPSNPITVFTGAKATAENAIAVGFKSVSSGTNAIAIGSDTSASAASSVALGSGAVANRADYATTNYKAYLNEDDSKTDSAWRSTHGAVAVGNGTTVTRQITGVAAGSEDTDAVNVAQLKSATPVINSAHNYYVGTTTAGVMVTDAVDAVDKALGKVAENGNFIKVYNATTPTGTFAENLTALDSAIGAVAADGNYIKKSATNNVSQNLSALDTQVKTNADNIAALQSSTTAAVGTLTEDGNYIKKSATNNVSQNLSALDTQAKTNADNIAANKAAIGTTTDGSYVKAANTVGKNLNALDTQVKTNTDDIATLKNSISVQEDASGTKTTTIEGNLVIKEKNGTTKDVTAALSTDGEVAKQGDAGSEGYLKGETVYDYLNKGDNGKEVKLATESQQISMGKGSEATGSESIAIGNEVGTQKNQATGTQSISIGFGNQVSGNHSGAIGDPTYIAADNSYAIGNSNNITATGTRSFAIGNNNTIGGSDTFVLGSNVNTNAANAVVLGNNSTGEANAVSVGSVGGERQIKHVAPGTDANDAATVGQLGALAQAADNGINRLDSKVNKVGAGAAALAALHPIDTDDKFTMGLGYGNYRNAHSAAIGLFYRPTEKVMISVGGTLGNGENMINAGISFALDKGKGFSNSKAMMARKIAAQEEKITQQDAKIQSLEEENAKLAARLAAIEEKLAK